MERRHAGAMTAARRRALGVALAAVGLALIVGLTLTPVEGPDTGTFQWCLRCGDVGLSDFIANVLLFMPLALGLTASGMSGPTVVGGALVLSLSIELAQLAIPGRESTLGDIVSNTAGAVVTVLLCRWWPVRRSAAAGFAAAAASLTALGGIGLVLRPAFPPTVYYGQWMADLGQFEWYRGKVLSATLGGMPLPEERLGNSRSVRDALVAGAPLVVRAVAGPRPSRLAPLFSIADSAYQEILVLGADRDDLVLRVRRRAADLGLGQPDLRWRGALATVLPGDTMALTARRTRSGYCLGLNGRERCGLGFAAGRAWALVRFVPGLSPVAQAALDCAIMAMVAFPVGALVRRNAAGLVTALVMLTGVVLVPILVGLLPTPALQVVASVAGLVVGGLAPGGDERAHAPVDAIIR